METSGTCSAEQLSMVSLDLLHAASPYLHVHVIHVFLSPEAHLDRQAVATSQALLSCVWGVS